MLSGASIFERERLVLHPGVLERQGFAFNKRPLQTNDFQVTVGLRTSGPAKVEEVPEDQSFAFWFVRQNISGDFNESRMIRALFEGIGAVFSTSDFNKKPSTAISFVSNDNHQSLQYGIDVPSSSAKVIDFRNKEVEFTFRVQPTLVQASLVVDGIKHDCFSVDRKSFPVKVGGYIGFSAWSGSGTKLPDSVSLTKVEVTNFDDEAIGEDVIGASVAEQTQYSEMMSSDSRHFVDQKSQTEHLVKVTNMLSSHLNENKPVYDVMAFQVSGMIDSLNRLDRDCRLLTKEMKILESKRHHVSKAPKNQNNLEELKSHVYGLRRLLEKEGKAQLHKLEAVQKNLNEVKEQASKASGSSMLTKLVDQTRLLEESVLARSSQMTWMLLILLVVIVVIGVLMFNRMRYYEKKHFI